MEGVFRVTVRGIMKRTQIYLAEEMIRQLKKESRKSGKSISEIIRESIRSRDRNSAGRILVGLDEAFGAWKGRSSDVERDIRDLRRDRKI